ncbi:MAG: putative collagen-binding domain-containing protein, partial [Bacteroidota bacterium]
IINLLWVAGGDNNGSGDLFPYENNMLRGIKEKDPDHLWTGHFDANLNVNWSTENKLDADKRDIDALYVWSETVMHDKGPQYKTELGHYNKVKMTMQLDQSYEHDAPHFADNENYQWIRRKMYDGLLSGCAGTSFSPGTADNQCYTFKNWKPLMNTLGMQQVSYCFRLFDSRHWEKLIPDQTEDIIIAGRGIFGTLDYVCAAKATDNSLYILYIPSGRIIYLNINKIAGKPLQCYWYNPRTGDVLKIGAIGSTDKFGFATPSAEDWVLVMDLEELKLPPPGIVKSK